MSARALILELDMCFKQLQIPELEVTEWQMLHMCLTDLACRASDRFLFLIADEPDISVHDDHSNNLQGCSWAVISPYIGGAPRKSPAFMMLWIFASWLTWRKTRFWNAPSSASAPSVEARLNSLSHLRISPICGDAPTAHVLQVSAVSRREGFRSVDIMECHEDLTGFRTLRELFQTFALPK